MISMALTVPCTAESCIAVWPDSSSVLTGLKPPVCELYEIFGRIYDERKRWRVCKTYLEWWTISTSECSPPWQIWRTVLVCFLLLFHLCVVYSFSYVLCLGTKILSCFPVHPAAVSLHRDSFTHQVSYNVYEHPINKLTITASCLLCEHTHQQQQYTQICVSQPLSLSLSLSLASLNK